MKKYLVRAGLAVGTLGLVVAGAAAFSAFESHIVNVTARIENGLMVDTSAIEFGTVFPQEYITSDIHVGLSDSFEGAGRVDDIRYTIKQKPKVKNPNCLIVAAPKTQLFGLIKVAQAVDLEIDTDPCNNNPTPGNPYAIIEVPGFGTEEPQVFEGPAWKFCEEYLPLDSNLEDTIGYTVDLLNPYWRYCYLPLANSLSKHETTEDGQAGENDVSIAAFHQAYQWDGGESFLNPLYIAAGHLVKSLNDFDDTWTIDLKVPCFVGACAQEAYDPLNTELDLTPGFYVPEAFQLDPKTEHKVFGTDLWIEVTEVSLTPISPSPTPAGPPPEL